MSQDIVHAICERHLVCVILDDHGEGDGGMALVQSLATSPEALPDSYVDEQGAYLVSLICLRLKSEMRSELTPVSER